MQEQTAESQLLQPGKVQGRSKYIIREKHGRQPLRSSFKNRLRARAALEASELSGRTGVPFARDLGESSRDKATAGSDYT